MDGVALSKGKHPARGPAARRGTVWARQAAPGRAERIGQNGLGRTYRRWLSALGRRGVRRSVDRGRDWSHA